MDTANKKRDKKKKSRQKKRQLAAIQREQVF